MDNAGARKGRPSHKAIFLESLSPVQNAKHLCKLCKRSFPRGKSLMAHERAHRGERNYICTYPGCDRRFIQSGQLRTHYLVHTKEKPYFCRAEGCGKRFAHSNRHCPAHPDEKLGKEDNVEIHIPDYLPEDQRTWLKTYKKDKEGRWKRRNPGGNVLEFHLNMEDVENLDPQESPEQLEIDQQAQANGNLPDEDRNNEMNGVVALAAEDHLLPNEENNQDANNPEIEDDALVVVREKLLLDYLMEFQAS